MQTARARVRAAIQQPSPRGVGRILVWKEQAMATLWQTGSGVAGLVAGIVAAVAPAPAPADIVVGPYTFDDRAFADAAHQIAPGTLDFFGTATSLEDALVGYSPTKMVVNLGNPSFSTANLLQLDFTDYIATNAAGPDIILFEAVYNVQSYEIAVRERGGATFSGFVHHDYTTLVPTGVGGPGNSTLHGLPIDLDAFGLAAGAQVDAFQFRTVFTPGAGRDGDPVGAAVLNGVVPEPGAASLLALAGALLLRRGRPDAARRA